MFSKRAGAVVISLDENNRCGDIKSGDQISYVGGQRIKDAFGFENAIKNVKKGDRVAMVVNWGPGGCYAIEDGNVGLDIVDAPSKSLKFGLDIYGGKKAWLSVNAQGVELENIKNVIEKRAKVSGISQFKVGVEDDRLFVAALNLNDVSPMISRGVLEGRIEEQLKLLDGVGQIKIGPKYYDIELLVPEMPITTSTTVDTETEIPTNVSTNFTSNETNSTNETNLNGTSGSTPAETLMDFSNASVLVEGNEYFVADSFVIGNISFKLLNITNDSLVVSGLVFKNEDVWPAAGVSSYVRYESSIRQYQFVVPIEFSESAGNAFAKITDGVPSVYTGSTSVLEGLLVYYIDGEEINRLSIPTDMASQNINSLSIIGIGVNIDDASAKKNMVEMALAGSLDYDILIGEVKEYDAGGVWLLYLLIGVVGVLSIILFILPYVAYKESKKSKISFWSLIVLLSIVFIVFGTAAMSQIVFAPGWVLDNVSIIGILVLAVWGFGWMFLTAEKILKRREFKIRRYVDIGLLFVSFVLLFTKFSGLGIAIIIGGLLNFLITGPLYKKTLSS